MAKKITRIVLTGGPAAGKTTLISRILKEFTQDDGWRVITIPETATDLISGFGIKPFGNCVSMYDFQYFVIADQLHKERLALKAAEMVPEDNILIVYDRAVFDDLAYINEEEFHTVLSSFGKTEAEILAGYDAVIHLVTCAKGAEYAYNYGNAARYEDVATAREKDDLALKAWSAHPSVHIVDNSKDFEEKINKAIAVIYKVLGQEVPAASKTKYLVSMPDLDKIKSRYNALGIDMMQTYLSSHSDRVEIRVRQQKSGDEYLYFYTEKCTHDDNTKWVTEKHISQKEYISYLMQCDSVYHPVVKTKYCFTYNTHQLALDVYPFSLDKAVLFVYGDDVSPECIPEEINIIRDITNDSEYKNRRLAMVQKL